MSEVVWTPPHPHQTQMYQFMNHANRQFCLDLKDYRALHAWSIQSPKQFWQNLCDFYQIEFHTQPKTIFQEGERFWEASWFPGATFNVAEQYLKGKDDQLAIISLREDGHKTNYTYAELKKAVAGCAAGMKAMGLQSGDRVSAVLPKVAETVIAMLATASIGAIWSSCSPDFGAQAIIDRLEQIEPKLLLICDGHTYHGKIFPETSKLEAITNAIPTLEQIVVYPYINHQMNVKTPMPLKKWQDFLMDNVPLKFTDLPFSHPLYILYSSGTTGKPKCIVHSAGGTYLQHIKELGLHTDLSTKDNLCFFTTCGWMMWNWMLSALGLGACITLYEGSPAFPDHNRLFQIIENEGISVFGTSAKFISAVEKAGVIPNQSFQLSRLRTILSTGSPLLPKNYDFVYQSIKKNVQLASISGGTDIVSCFALGNPMLPVYRGELQCKGLGMAVDVFNDEGKSVQEEKGELVCTQPFPSMPIYFWQDSDKKKYIQAYFNRFPNVWAHGDFAEITAHQGLVIHGRSDAVLNPGGVRIGTAEIYRQVEKVPEVLDAVVIGQEWEDDIRVILFVKLQENITLDDSLIQSIKQTIRRHASPRHVPDKVLQVQEIPKTINGKTVEIAIKQTIEGKPVKNLESLANPSALNEYKNRTELRD